MIKTNSEPHGRGVQAGVELFPSKSWQQHYLEMISEIRINRMTVSQEMEFLRPVSQRVWYLPALNMISSQQHCNARHAFPLMPVVCRQQPTGRVTRT